MPLISNAAPDELSSSYYLANKSFCEEFESFVIEKGGKIVGSYNSWSYEIIATIPHQNNWTFRYKKATYSSGSLLLSSEYQNLSTIAIWTADFNTNSSDFYTRKRKFRDIFTLGLNRYQKLDINPNYIIKSNSPQSTFLQNILKTLNALFYWEEIYSLKYQNGKLTVELRTKDLHLNKIEKLLTFQF